MFRGSTRLLRGFNGRRCFPGQWFMSVYASEISRWTQCFYFHHSDRNPEQRSRADCLNEDVSLFPAVLSECLLHVSNVLSPSSLQQSLSSLLPDDFFLLTVHLLPVCIRPINFLHPYSLSSRC